ncbi:Uncharacterized protein FWK35_00002524 [Aphis craccivora]|uniref:Uncharacterized protein n=1 Tax=Aphis craccivora TaxID=307492 RepID=A0A6G0ZHI4_APHCR|nr:Uncharacterized protein FWK35_00002524 [Aphis craccivora]
MSSVAFCKGALKMEQNAVADWSSYIPEVCVWKLENNQNKEIGGPSLIFEIDKIDTNKGARVQNIERIERLWGSAKLENKKRTIITNNSDDWRGDKKQVPSKHRYT